MLKIQSEITAFDFADGKKNITCKLEVTPYQIESLNKLLFRPVHISISARHSARTLPKNKYLWDVVYPTIARDTGHTVEDLHEIFKTKFLPIGKVLWNKATGQFVEAATIGGSTAELSPIEFAEYIEKICAMAAQIGIYVPKPNEVEYE